MSLPLHVLDVIQNLKPALFLNSFDKLFAWKDLENILNLRPFVNTNRFRILENNVTVYRWSMQFWMTDPNSYPPSLLDYKIRTHAGNLIDASRINEKINQICCELDNALNGCTDAHIFFDLTDTKSKGLGIHWDYSHNLIIQMEGETHAQIWNTEISGERTVDSLRESPTVDAILKPGDAIFIPLRTYHNLVSVTNRLSVSFPVSMENSYPCQERHWIKI